MKDPKEGTLHSLNKDLQRAQDPHTLPPIPADKLNNSRHRKTLSGNAMSEIPFLQLSCTTCSMLNDWFSEVRKHLQRTVQISHVHEEKKKEKNPVFLYIKLWLILIYYASKSVPGQTNIFSSSRPQCRSSIPPYSYSQSKWNQPATQYPYSSNFNHSENGSVKFQSIPLVFILALRGTVDHLDLLWVPDTSLGKQEWFSYLNLGRKQGGGNSFQCKALNTTSSAVQELWPWFFFF